MPNELETTIQGIDKSGPSTSAPQQADSLGITPVSEEKDMTGIERSHEGLLSPSKDAAPVETDTSSITIPELAAQKPQGKPMKDSSWGLIHMARKFFERQKKKG